MANLRHVDVEIAELKRSLVSMGDLVERALELGGGAILRPVVEARDQAREVEEQLDRLETAIEEQCQRIIMLQGPMAGDMRFVMSAMRVVTDLERIGDLAESVAKRARWIAKHHAVENPAELPELVAIARTMVHQALQALVNGDLALPRTIVEEEDRADVLTKACSEAVQRLMAQRLDAIPAYTHLLRAIGALEHIADLGVSIAEEVVYIHKARLVRHQHEDMPR